MYAIAMTSTTCPVSLRYAPALARLEKDLAARGVAFILVNDGWSGNMNNTGCVRLNAEGKCIWGCFLIILDNA